MSFTQLASTDRRARKPYHCGMCAARIEKGDLHHVSTTLWDGRVHDWRECIHCDRDGIVDYVHSWTGGYYYEGGGYDQAAEWAEVVVQWPKRWSSRVPSPPISASQRMAARRWLARAAGGEGE